MGGPFWLLNVSFGGIVNKFERRHRSKIIRLYSNLVDKLYMSKL